MPVPSTRSPTVKHTRSVHACTQGCCAALRTQRTHACACACACAVVIGARSPGSHVCVFVGGCFSLFVKLHLQQTHTLKQKIKRNCIVHEGRRERERKRGRGRRCVNATFDERWMK